MGSKVKDALISVYNLAEKLQKEGLTVAGTVSVTIARNPVPGEAGLFVAPDGRFGILRIVAKALSPGATSLLPQTDPGAFNAPNPPPHSLQALSNAVASVVAPGDGVVRDSGAICTTCSGTAFRRMGSCLYCVACGDSVGWCS